MTNSTARKRLAETTAPTDDALGPHAANLDLDAIRELASRQRYVGTTLARDVHQLLAEVDRLTTALAAAEGRLERVRALTLAWQHDAPDFAPVFYERVLAALNEGPR